MRRNFGIAIALLVASAGLAVAAQPTFTSQPAINPPAAPLIPPPGDPVNMIVDDGVLENNIGLNNTTAGTASMFEWFNRFSPTEFPIEVSRVDIYWNSAYVTVGNAIELLVFEGGDNPCATGGTIRADQNDTVAAVDTFDQYTLTTPAQVTAGPSVSLAVIDRWVVSGVDPSTYPAAIDTTASQGRSWVASWAADPPNPPQLPSDGLCGTIDSFGLPGNWLIRGAGTVVPVELQHFSAE